MLRRCDIVEIIEENAVAVSQRQTTLRQL